MQLRRRCLGPPSGNKNVNKDCVRSGGCDAGCVGLKRRLWTLLCFSVPPRSIIPLSLPHVYSWTVLCAPIGQLHHHVVEGKNICDALVSLISRCVNTAAVDLQQSLSGLTVSPVCPAGGAGVRMTSLLQIWPTSLKSTTRTTSRPGRRSWNGRHCMRGEFTKCRTVLQN